MTKIPKEKVHHNNALQPLSNSRTWRDFLENDAYMQFPANAEWCSRFAYTLLEWATKDDSVEITDFALEMKMRRQTIYEWAAKYPVIKDALDQARLMIGSRRRKGALTRKFDKDVVFKDMHKYDPEWLEINKYHSDMKKDEEKQPTTFVLTDLKPKVKTQEEMQQESETNL